MSAENDIEMHDAARHSAGDGASDPNAATMRGAGAHTHEIPDLSAEIAAERQRNAQSVSSQRAAFETALAALAPDLLETFRSLSPLSEPLPRHASVPPHTGAAPQQTSGAQAPSGPQAGAPLAPSGSAPPPGQVPSVQQTSAALAALAPFGQSASAPSAAAVAAGPPPSRPTRRVTKALCEQAGSPGFAIAVRMHLKWMAENDPRSFPWGLLDSVDDLTAVHWIDSYFQGLTNPSVMDIEQFITAFRHYLCGEVRSAAELALEDLVLGRVVQGTQPVARYAEQFMQRVRYLPDETQVSLCARYLAGLNKHVRARCVRDPQHRAWASLSDLIAASVTEELKWQALKSFDTPSAPASVSVRSAQGPSDWPAQNNKRAAERQAASAQKKRHTLAAAAPAAGCASESGVAAVAVSEPSAPPPAGNVKRSRRVYTHPTTGASLDPRSAPVELCPVYGSTSPLPEIRNTLSDWGMCFYCRRCRDHSVSNCPNRPPRSAGPSASK